MTDNYHVVDAVQQRRTRKSARSLKINRLILLSEKIQITPRRPPHAETTIRTAAKFYSKNYNEWPFYATTTAGT